MLINVTSTMRGPHQLCTMNTLEHKYNKDILQENQRGYSRIQSRIEEES